MTSESIPKRRSPRRSNDVRAARSARRLVKPKVVYRSEGFNATKDGGATDARVDIEKPTSWSPCS